MSQEDRKWRNASQTPRICCWCLRPETKTNHKYVKPKQTYWSLKFWPSLNPSINDFPRTKPRKIPHPPNRAYIKRHQSAENCGVWKGLMGPCALICTPAWKLLGDCGISEHNFLPFFTYLSHSETWCGQVWWIKEDKENKKGLELYEEKTMAPHSSTLAWRIPWMEEPGRLQSMGSLRVGHDWATSLSLFTFMPWRRKWQPTPVFLPGESQGRGAWWASVYGVAQSGTRLKRLSSSRTLWMIIYWGGGGIWGTHQVQGEI